jgi:alcohol dehydrogenase class IV
MSDFALLRAPSQVLFGTGMAEAVGGIAARNGKRAFVCTDPVIAGTDGFATVAASLEAAGMTVVVFDGASVDVPMAVIEAAVAAGRAAEPDVVVAVGGGSVIDLAKVTALLLRHPGPLSTYYAVGSVPGPITPLIALPTTAGTGSEVTPVSVITDPERGMKVGVASAHLIPQHAICDPLLTVDCPPLVTAHAGIDALSHAIEAAMAIDETPTPAIADRVQVGRNLLSDGLALIAVRHLAKHLVRAVEDGTDLEARSGMLYGSLLAGIAFGNAGVSAAHALQFAIGAATGTSHGLGTGLMLPYVMEYNRPAREAVLADIAQALADGLGTAVADPIAVVHELGERIGLPASLAALDVAREDLPRLARESVGIKRLIDNNPRPLDVDALEAILTAAWHGDPALLAAPTIPA